ncbi:odorant receptor Or2-like isoform X2 [Belonocnema kinseyi]|uniref:odorant receptor Or2-like isoform X2 n=1 Tax=Belonocnema kinseyi TaxID=2817044 RepID=UPI00143D6E19|nr:odorant receptor Or2-like isoform X2 [Belonocnema kinseyi]
MPLVPQVLNVILPLNETRPKIPLFIAEFYIDKDQYYYLIFIHNYCTTFLFILFYLIGDIILMASVQHASGVLAAIGYRLNSIMNSENYNSTSGSKIKQQIFEDISFCAKEHMNIIIFVKDIHECCSTAFFVTIAINMAVTHLDDPDQAIRYATSAINQIVHLFCLSVPCQQLTNEGNNISDCIYNGKWYEFPVRSKKLLLMIMKKSSEPCQFTAGKIYTYSMQSFATVLKTSMSYFTVLSSFQ